MVNPIIYANWCTLPSGRFTSTYNRQAKLADDRKRFEKKFAQISGTSFRYYRCTIIMYTYGDTEANRSRFGSAKHSAPLHISVAHIKILVMTKTGVVQRQNDPSIRRLETISSIHKKN